MTKPGSAFYARSGGRLDDFLTLLHVPYTLWHLSYVVIGASLAADIDAVRLVGTLLAFTFGLGIGAHALDELHDRPLSTGLGSGTLHVLGWGGLAAGFALAVTGAFLISPWALLWGLSGVLLAAAYTLEWSHRLHSAAGFAAAWGAFPVLVGYWAQTESVSVAAVVVSASAVALSLAQRALSTPARHVRRRQPGAWAQVGEARWDRSALLTTWERPLQWLAAAHVLLAAGLISAHIFA